MRKDKEKATKLRRSGVSYKKINQELGIPLSTLSKWFKNEQWSQGIKNELSRRVSLSNPKALKFMAQVNKERWKLKYEEYRTAAVLEFKKLKDNPLFLIAIALYWSRGDTRPSSSQVIFKDSDMESIKIFHLFLTKAIRIEPDKISLRLIIYPDMVESVQKNLWSKILNVPIEKFKKSIFIKGHKAKKRTSYGICVITVNSRALKERMLKWIELCQDLIKRDT